MLRFVIFPRAVKKATVVLDRTDFPTDTSKQTIEILEYHLIFKGTLATLRVNVLTSSFLLFPFLHQTTSPTGQGRSDSPVYTNLQELKISQSNLPPVPSSSPLHILGDWETHKDLSGRHFYYNRATGERTWKPPRTRDTSSSTSSFRGDSQGTAESEVSREGCAGHLKVLFTKNKSTHRVPAESSMHKSFPNSTSISPFC